MLLKKFFFFTEGIALLMQTFSLILFFFFFNFNIRFFSEKASICFYNINHSTNELVSSKMCFYFQDTTINLKVRDSKVEIAATLGNGMTLNLNLDKENWNVWMRLRHERSWAFGFFSLHRVNGTWLMAMYRTINNNIKMRKKTESTFEFWH